MNCSAPSDPAGAATFEVMSRLHKRVDGGRARRQLVCADGFGKGREREAAPQFVRHAGTVRRHDGVEVAAIDGPALLVDGAEWDVVGLFGLL